MPAARAQLETLTMATPAEMAAAMLANLEAKTGKPLDAWMTITRSSGLEKHGQILKLLKDEYGVTHGFANLLAHETLSTGTPVEAELVEAQYAGRKADLRPIYEALLAVVSKFGRDVDISPKKTYVSLRRNKQFALIKPSTATRIDIGLNLQGEPVGTRLEASGSFSAMCTHRVRVTSPSEVDAELRRWLKQAYTAS